MFENEAAKAGLVSADQQEGLRSFLEKRKPALVEPLATQVARHGSGLR